MQCLTRTITIFINLERKIEGTIVAVSGPKQYFDFVVLFSLGSIRGRVTTLSVTHRHRLYIQEHFISDLPGIISFCRVYANDDGEVECRPWRHVQAHLKVTELWSVVPKVMPLKPNSTPKLIRKLKKTFLCKNIMCAMIYFRSIICWVSSFIFKTCMYRGKSELLLLVIIKGTNHLLLFKKYCFAFLSQFDLRPILSSCYNVQMK